MNRWLRRFEHDIGPGLFYLHPSELDSESPTAPHLSRWFLRLGRERFVDRLSRLMEDVQFSSIEEVFGNSIGSTNSASLRV